MYYLIIPQEQVLIKVPYKVECISRLLVLDYLPIDVDQELNNSTYRHITTGNLAYIIRER